MRFYAPPTLAPVMPQGRLTLTTATPVLTTTVAGAATVFYTPYNGSMVPLWNGVQFVPTSFTELSNVLANSATGNAGPAAGAAAKNYYMLVWNNAGVPTLTRSPAWTSDIDPGTGAGTAQVSTVQGVRVNTVAITNGPAAGYGTVVGVIRTDAGAATVTWQFGATASGGTPGNFHVRNTYNRIEVRSALSENNGASHTYTSATVQAFNNSTGMRFSSVRDFAREDDFEIWAGTRMGVLGVANANGIVGIGIDTVVAFSDLRSQAFVPTVAIPVRSQADAYYVDGTIGFHFYSLNEASDGTNAVTFFHSPAMEMFFAGKF